MSTEEPAAEPPIEISTDEHSQADHAIELASKYFIAEVSNAFAICNAVRLTLYFSVALTVLVLMGQCDLWLPAIILLVWAPTPQKLLPIKSELHATYKVLTDSVQLDCSELNRLRQARFDFLIYVAAITVFWFIMNWFVVVLFAVLAALIFSLGLFGLKSACANQLRKCMTATDPLSDLQDIQFTVNCNHSDQSIARVVEPQLADISKKL